jgi:hypothetical protein
LFVLRCHSERSEEPQHLLLPLHLFLPLPLSQPPAQETVISTGGGAFAAEAEKNRFSTSAPPQKLSSPRVCG